MATSSKYVCSEKFQKHHGGKERCAMIATTDVLLQRFINIITSDTSSYSFCHVLLNGCGY